MLVARRILFLLTLGLVACDSQAPTPSILVISLDTTRASVLAPYGGPVQVPSLTKLRENGVLFSRAFAPVPLTLPSHTTLLSGMDPPRHRVYENGAYRVGEGVPLMSETLKEEGYQTGAFVSSYVLDGQFGLSRGFDVYDDAMDEGEERQGAKTVEAALRWLETLEPGQPFFGFVHMYDPHYPYRTTEVGGEEWQPYYDEIVYADHEIGRLLEWLDDSGRSDDTFVVFVSDHGEAFGDHGEDSHGYFIYDEVMHVPLILKGPGIERGGRVDRVVALKDVAPTLWDAVGVVHPEGVQGSSLFSPEAEGSDSFAYLESRYASLHFGWSPLHGLRTDQHKLIAAPKPELYAFETDAKEENNLYADSPREAGALEARLKAYIRESESFVVGATSVELSDEERQRLESLGYTSGPLQVHGGSGEDPKDMIAIYKRLNRLPVYAALGRQVDRIAESRLVLREDPENAVALEHLGLALSKSKRYQESLAPLRRAIEKGHDGANLRYRLGVSLFNVREHQEAKLHFEKTLEASSSDGRAHRYLGILAEHEGRRQDAIGHYEAFLGSADPNAPTVQRVRARVEALKR